MAGCICKVQHAIGADANDTSIFVPNFDSFVGPQFSTASIIVDTKSSVCLFSFSLQIPSI